MKKEDYNYIPPEDRKGCDTCLFVKWDSNVSTRHICTKFDEEVAADATCDLHSDND